ncbi:folylpolyglutamate synthase [Silene latifolia]|uniref:folylpolyglutamate synthase n=1 Tax=Silene latifolia TaxID=37657 RepID=UPI003D76CEB9
MQSLSNGFIRREVIGISRFYDRGRWLSIITACRSPSFPPCLNGYDPASLCIQSRMMSSPTSQVLEKIRNNKISEELLSDLSHSRSYETAMEALSSLIRGRKRGDKSTVGGKYTKLERMVMYLKILGLEEKIAGLKIIHVAGTKGKGSTCAFSEAILRECGFRTGLFTSPHLIDVRERFRIDGLDISEEAFLRYFWDCWDQLREKVSKELPMPPLFQFLSLMAFKIFVHEKVDVGIFEVGLGGRNDSTNVIKEPVVCGITSLGMDHMEILGDTLAKIAAHKAGIFKPNIPAFTVIQPPEAMTIIKERAHELKVPLGVVSPLSREDLNGLQLSLAGDHQFANAGLAVTLCTSWLELTGNSRIIAFNDDNKGNLPDAFLRGLSAARLSGRAQIVHDTIPKSSNISSGDLTFYLDGAHSPESIDACARWFSDAVKGSEGSKSMPSLDSSFTDGRGQGMKHNVLINRNRENTDKNIRQVLLFNCMEVRNPQLLLSELVETCASSGVDFSRALFVPSISSYNKVISGSTSSSLDIPARELSWQLNLQRIWEKIMQREDSDIAISSMVDFSKAERSDYLPLLEFLNREYSHEIPGGYSPRSAVLPSLPLTIKWLRDCVRENPSLRLQVLVTGSLHLVGDVLKLLRS